MATSIPASTESFPALQVPSSTPSITPSTLPTINEVAEAPASQSVQLPSLLSVESSPKFDRSRFSPARSPVALTGAIALADAKRKRQQDTDRSRQTTPNPQVGAMQSLMGGPSAGMSRPSDAPVHSKLSEPLKKVADKIVIPENGNIATDSMQTSPISMSSLGTADGTNGTGPALTATTIGSTTSTASPSFHAEPAEMLSPGTRAPAPQQQEDSSKAFSYPGPLALQQQSQDMTPARGRSLSGLEYADSAKSSPASGSKRYKCPYCATDFTRHHNLKSHLLTHSQEKPYVCHACQARFRRLHDLKRHARLHTGERPHTCEKCGRSFARGDALARHNKGPGGCAGRRSSFGGEDGDGADDMDGVEYGMDDEAEDSGMLDAQGRRVSEPSRKRVQIETPHDPNRTIYRQHSSTYPPIQHRPGDMGPPAVVHPNAQATSPREIPGQPSGNAGPGYYPGFNQHTGPMTESPKPLSPGQPPDSNRLSIDAGSSMPMGRNRSPSLTTQFQQTHFGRGSGGRTPPQGQFQSSTQLPPLSLSTAITRPPLHSNLSGPGPSSLQHHQSHQPHNMSNPASASSQGQSSGSSMRDILAGGGPGSGGGDADLWAHVRQLEGRFSRMQDEYELRISRLQEEVISLRGQLNSVASQQSQSNYSGENRY